MNGNCHPPPPPLEVYPIPLITEAVLYPKKKKRKEERKRNQTQDQLIFKRYTYRKTYNLTTTIQHHTLRAREQRHHVMTIIIIITASSLCRCMTSGLLGCPLHIASLVNPSMPPNFSLPSPSRLSPPFPLSFTYLIIAGSYLLGPGGSPLILPQ